MKRSTTAVVNIVQTHRLNSDKVVERSWLISLSCDMQDICSVNISSSHISLHFFHQDLYQFEVSMICCKMQSRELFICHLVSPNLECLLHRSTVFILRQVEFTSMRINKLEAKRVVLEGTESKSSVLS